MVAHAVPTVEVKSVAKAAMVHTASKCSLFSRVVQLPLCLKDLVKPMIFDAENLEEVDGPKFLLFCNLVAEVLHSVEVGQ